ncbi:MAG TPA: DUF2322 family protein [Sulfuriferula sp.]|nr:DUF2322 family protein [Sulfuriferula sp.]
MTNFAENLEKLESVDAFGLMKLFGEDGEVAAVIENKPGSSGSFRVYYHVALKWGGVGPKAAQEALALFAEHAEDARAHPGKHPNIDRLLQSIEHNTYYSVRCYPA